MGEMQKAEEIQSKKKTIGRKGGKEREGEGIININKLWKVHTVGKNSRA